MMSTFETIGNAQFLVYAGQQQLAAALGAALKSAFRRLVRFHSSRSPIFLP
jgi:hypothetical protein